MSHAPMPTKEQECPVDHTAFDRKTFPQEPKPQSSYQINDDGTWTIFGFDEARQILRSDLVKQAGFQAERVTEQGAQVLKNQPILFLEGEEHHAARRETNRFFTPSITDKNYREFMNNYADEVLQTLKDNKRANLSDLSMDMAVQVASKIVGLTDSWFAWGLKSRLEAMMQTGENSIQGGSKLKLLVQGQFSTINFLLWDVLPAIRQRRKNPQNDVISYLIDKDYSNLEILTECLVYGVAGMVTTREFISVALWHLFDNPHLMERMKVGSEKERYAILHEILRLEPVVSHLYRRTIDDLTIQSNGETITIPADTKLDLHIAAANLDDNVMGEDAASVCPMREMADLRPKVPEFGLSFGDGAHRCPGAFVAIQESDIFLQKLLQIEGLHIERAPDVSFFKIAESYELRNFILSVD